MDLSEGLIYAWNGRALLFLGSGFSLGASNVNGKGFLSGSAFASHLARKTGLPEDLALEEVAEAFVHSLSEDALIDEVFYEFTASSVTEAQKVLAQVPWRRVYTTNYDNVFEASCAQKHIAVRSVAPTENIEQVSKSGLMCIHLNGSIQTLSRESLWADLKLTGSSYDSSPLSDSAWTGLFRSDLRAAQAVFFVGYSMWDLDVRRLAAEEDLRDKCFFILGTNPTPSTKYRAERYGSVTSFNTDQFAEQILIAEALVDRNAIVGPLPYCLEQYLPEANPISLEDRYIFDLVLFGRLRTGLIPSTFESNRRYVSQRSIGKRIINRLNEGTRLIVLHSSLGNGKTSLMESLKYEVYKQGFTVFSLRNRGETLDEEIQNTFRVAGKKVFFIDNYPEWMESFSIFGSYLSETFSVVVSARSNAHDVLIPRVVSDLKTADFYEAALDLLNDEEIEWISAYFDEYGLWGDRTTDSLHAKRRYLQKDCGGEWHSILLNLLESPHIVDKLQSLFANFQREGAYTQPLLSLLALGVMGFQPAKNDAADLCGDAILEGGFKRDAVVSEIIEFGRDSYSSRSATMSEYILKKVANPNSVVRAVVSLLERADEKHAVSRYHSLIFRQSIRFSNLSYLFSDRDRGRATMSIYEAIKNLPRVKRAPLFWLQYAIAALFAKDYARSESYFKVAYSHAESLDEYDTFQIDNHYARFLIARVIESHNVSAAMPTFRDSRKLLYHQLATDRRHYPFRVASTWSDFYSAFEGELDDSSVAELRRAAVYVVTKIERLPADRQSHHSVLECWERMQRLITATPEPTIDQELRD